MAKTDSIDDRLELSIQLIAATTKRAVDDLRNEAADLLLGRYESALRPFVPDPATAPREIDHRVTSQEPPGRHHAQRPAQRAFIGRSLSNLAEGHHVWCKGVEGVTRGGRLWIGGQAFDAPTPAAKAAAASKSLPETEVNGWVTWRDREGRTLADIHDRMLAPL